jgi:hypothetical protein
MADIRPFERDDLPAVTGLMRDHLGAWDTDVGLLEATLWDHPWADPELPSLVAVDDDGEVIGFIGVQPRRIEFDGASLRAVCCSHLVVRPQDRGSGPGALLVSRVMGGPQEITWTDTANQVVARIWGVLGGRVDHTRASDWMIVLRPMRWGSRALGAATGLAAGSGNLPVPGLPLQAAGARLVPSAHPASPENVAGKHATAAEIAAAMPEICRRFTLFVAYDEEVLDYTFRLVEATRGRLIRRIVKRRRKAVGWYAYLLQPGGVSTVLHLAAAPRDVEAVFGELVEHSASLGSAALAGRYEPHLEAPLRLRMAILGLARRPVVHTQHPHADVVLANSTSLLTRLDGEWFVP